MKLYRILSDKIHEYVVLNEHGDNFKTLNSSFTKLNENKIVGAYGSGKYKSFTTNKDNIKYLRKEIIKKEKEFVVDRIKYYNNELEILNNL